MTALLAADARILLDRKIGLARPRSADDLRVDPEFVALHKELSAALKEEQS